MPSASSRENPERRLGQVVRPEGEEVRFLRDLVGPQRGARELDHRAAQVLDRRLLGGDALGQLAEPGELFAEADERVHDLDERRVAGPLRRPPAPPARSRAPASRRSRGTGARACTHACRASGSTRAAPGSARASRRRSPPRAAAGTRAAADRAAGSSPESPAIASKIPSKSPCCRGSNRSSAERRSSSSRARIISRTIGSRPSAMNMCSVRQRPMPSAPNSRALAASSGVSAFARTRMRLSSSAQPEDRPEVLVDRRGNERNRADDHVAGAAVDRDHVSRSELALADLDRARLVVDREPFAARDARLAHATRDDRGVRGHPAVRGQDARARGSVRGCRREWSPNGRGSRRRLPCRAPRRCPRRGRSRPKPHRATRSGRGSPPRSPRSGRSWDGEAGRAARDRCAQLPRRVRSAPRPPSRRRP